MQANAPGLRSRGERKTDHYHAAFPRERSPGAFPKNMT